MKNIQFNLRGSYHFHYYLLVISVLIQERKTYNLSIIWKLYWNYFQLQSKIICLKFSISFITFGGLYQFLSISYGKSFLEAFVSDQ